MATSTLVPIAEYLTTSYRPDCDYVDGELQERNLGEAEHSDLQVRLTKLLTQTTVEVHIRANTELRVQVKPTRFRVPDVCVRHRSAPHERILKQPPLLCIEVLSPDDTVRRVREKVRDYLEMGVLAVWVLDPGARSVTIYDGATIVEQTTGALTVPGVPVELQIAEIFSALDDYEQ